MCVDNYGFNTLTIGMKYNLSYSKRDPINTLAKSVSDWKKE